MPLAMPVRSKNPGAALVCIEIARRRLFQATRSGYSRWVEYFLYKVGHERSTFTYDVGQSCYLAVTRVSSSLLLMLLVHIVGLSSVIDRGINIIVIIIKFIHIIAAFCCTRTVVRTVSAYTCSANVS